MVVLYVLKQVVMFVLFIHLIYRFIQFYQSIKEDTYEKDNKHTFVCSKCEQTHTLDGEQLKSLRWKSRSYQLTPFSQSSSIHFECPHCQTKAGQRIQYDYNVTKALGLFRLQMNESQKKHLIRFLILGVLPILIIMAVWQFVSTIIQFFI